MGNARNTLDRKQARALEDWLLEKRALIATDRTDRYALASIASKALCFDVSDYHVATAAKTVGVAIPKKARPKGIRLGAQRNVLMIGKLLAAFMAKLGEPIPPELSAYIASKDGK